MKSFKCIYIPFMIAVFIILNSSSAFALDGMTKEPIDGFRGIKWDKPIGKYKNIMTLYGTDGTSGVKTYTRHGDNQYIGGAYIGPVFYQFDEVGFYSASFYIFYTKGSPYSDVKSAAELHGRFLKIYNACIKQWGKPQKTIVQPPKIRPNKTVRYAWDFPNATARVDKFSGYVRPQGTRVGLYEESIIFTITSNSGMERDLNRMQQVTSDF